MIRRAEPVAIQAVEARAFRVPTTRPESDGTLEWDATSVCVVDLDADGVRGFGYGYTAAASAQLIRDTFAPVLRGRSALDTPAAWELMRGTIRNIGQAGLGTAAIGVVDIALWDLKAKLLDVNVGTLLGARRASVPVYASGGFTSLSAAELRDQLAGWVDEGITRVKMKVGREPDRDVARVAAARDAIGPDAELFVDANGGYDRAGAVGMAHRFAEHDVSWFEEPVSSQDLVGLRWIRDRVPPGMRVTAGEYGWDAVYFRRMCEAGAADVIQPDVTRCGGYTGFLRAAEVCDAFGIPISAHTAPQLDVHVCCAAPRVLHLEWFHDHAGVADLLIEGAARPVDGAMRPDRTRPGIGLSLKERDAEPYRVL